MIPTRNTRHSITKYAQKFKKNHPSDYQRLMLTASKCNNPRPDGKKSEKTKPITNHPFDLFSHPSHPPLSHRDKKSRVTLGFMSQSELSLTQGSQSTTKSQLRHTQKFAINLAHHYISIANTDKNVDVVSDKQWPGTIRYQDIIEECFDEYAVLLSENKYKKKPDKKTKAKIFRLAKNVMEQVKPGRFLTNADAKNDMRSLMDEDDVVTKIVQALRKRNDNKKTKMNANDEDDMTNDYFSAARNMLTGELHEYAMGKDYFGEETKKITDEEMKKWCDQGSVQNFTLPTWVKCKDVFLNGKWYRVPDEKCSVRNLHISSHVGFRPDGSLPVDLQTGDELVTIRFKRLLQDKVVCLDCHAACALLFGAPNNSNQSFEPDRLEVDHITEGQEGKTMEMSLTITNLQFLTGAQNKDKFYKWKRVMRKDREMRKTNITDV